MIYFFRHETGAALGARQTGNLAWVIYPTRNRRRLSIVMRAKAKKAGTGAMIYFRLGTLDG
jgi:hypothetical protein